MNFRSSPQHRTYQWTKTSFVLLAASVIALMALIPFTSAAQVANKTTATVQIGASGPGTEGNGFFPSVIVIRAGDTVVWTAAGDAPHTVTSVNVTGGKPLFDSSPLFELTPELAAVFFGPGGFMFPGASYVVDTATLQPGTYHYQCTLHDGLGMNGTLIVTSDPAPSGAVSTVTVGWAGAGLEITLFSPSTLTVAQGTKVIFTSNAGLEPHDVVSETTLSNGTTILGTAFDSSPNLVPPGISEDALNNAPPPFPIGNGGLMVPFPGLDKFNHTFSQPGNYIYYCKLHSTVISGVRVGMVGQVIVLPAYASDQDVQTVQAQVTAAQGSITSVQGSVTSAQSSIASAQGSIASAQGSISSIQSSLSSVSQSVQSAINQLPNTASKSDLNSLTSQVSNLSSQVGTLTSQVSTLNTIAYVALGIAVVLGLVAIGLSRRKSS